MSTEIDESGAPVTVSVVNSVTGANQLEAGTYDIIAYGAQGGAGTYAKGGENQYGGYGGYISGDVTLIAGEVLEVVVGGQGGNASGYEGGGGGGGGSFVFIANSTTPLLVAGGGGGGPDKNSNYSAGPGGYDAAGSGSGGAGGNNNNHGGNSGGGAGWLSNGVNGHASGGAGLTGPSFAGGSSSHGGTPGQSNYKYGGHGGFGGGGGGAFNGGGGGGGGFSGGYGGDSTPSKGGDSYGGQGGTSYAASSVTNVQANFGTNAGDGKVVFDLLCYLRGTHILTPTGEVCVEDLRIGDAVVTRFGAIQPVKWIGRQSYETRLVAANREWLPVCIAAGALGVNLPARDLYVSPAHSMLVDGQLVLASALVNGLTITQDWTRPRIDYFQIELAAHDCVIAEGTWSETFADGPGLRARFHNAAEFEALYPDDPPPVALRLCAPRPECGAALDAALRPVVARAGVGLWPGPLRGSLDLVQAPRQIEGWAQDEAHPELPVLLEILLEDRVIGSALACDYRADLAKAGIGQGRCAFLLTAPVLLRPSVLAAVRVRRASDGAEIPMSQACQERVGAARKMVAPARLRLAV